MPGKLARDWVPGDSDWRRREGEIYRKFRKLPEKSRMRRIDVWSAT